MNENLIVTDTELMILLAARGIRRLHGFARMETAEDSVPYVMHEMVRKELLRQEGEHFRIAEPYRSMVEVLGMARLLLSIRGVSGQACYIYVGETYVYLADSVNDRAAVKLGLLHQTEVLELLEECFFSESQAQYPEELRWSEMKKEKRTLLATAELILSGEEKVIAEWKLYEGKYDKVMEEWEDGCCREFSYDEWQMERLLEKTEKWRRGGADDIN